MKILRPDEVLGKCKLSGIVGRHGICHSTDNIIVKNETKIC
jgi:hypothetical protein